MLIQLSKIPSPVTSRDAFCASGDVDDDAVDDDATSTMPPSASRSPRRLFGGALACALDARFEDASTFMPSIPNHQEIFVDRARDETVIVELVDAIEDRTGSSLGAFAFEDACDACDAIERRLVTSRTASVSGRGDGDGDGVGDVVVAYGVMRASKSRSTDVNDVDVWGAIIRLPRANTDALVWHCRPFAFACARRTPGGDNAAPSDETRVRRGVKSSLGCEGVVSPGAPRCGTMWYEVV